MSIPPETSSLFEPVGYGPTFTAAYESDAACDCGDSIVPGDDIRWAGARGYVHATCPIGRESDDRAAGRLCPLCFCFHAGECA